MKCQNCGKNNANVSYTRIVNGNRMELHLCSECAREMNINVNFNFGLDNMFSSFFDDFARVRSLSMPGFSGLRALERGLDSFMDDSFFGGDLFIKDNNYLESKTDKIDELLNEIQKKHKVSKKNKTEKEVEKNKDEKIEKNTKKPMDDKKQNEINQLKLKIQEYIKSEEYEKAAVLRDKIKELSEE